MEVIRDLLASPATRERVVAGIGTFDGVHLGHRALIAEVVRRSRHATTRSVILTFDPHPQEILAPRPGRRLMELDEKLEVLDGLGVDDVFVLNFTHELSRFSPRRFIDEVLIGRLGVLEVIVGFNFTFGAGGTGTPATLDEAGPAAGFTVETLPPVEVEGQVVSSSVIRSRLEAGRVAEAARLLGRAYELVGPVVTGAGRGRRLGFPTANLAVDPARRVIPRRGVYRGQARIPAGDRPCLINVGINPTFPDGPHPPLKVEAHLPGFSGDLAGRTIRVSFESKLRDETRFESPEHLIRQIEKDLECLTSPPPRIS